MGCSESKLIKLVWKRSGNTESEATSTSAAPKQAGLLSLPWEVMEQILLQRTLTFRDVVSTLRILASPHQTAREYVAEVTGSELLWLTKFRSLYPSLYRILLKYESSHVYFDWYDVLKTRCDTGRGLGPRLRMFREKCMEENLAKLDTQEFSVLANLLNCQLGDIRHPGTGDAETSLTKAIVTSVNLEALGSQKDPPGHIVFTAFVGSGALADDRTDNQFDVLTCQRAFQYLMIQARMLGYHAEERWILVDACREYLRRPGTDMRTGVDHHTLYSLKLCQMAACYWRWSMAVGGTIGNDLSRAFERIFLQAFSDTRLSVLQDTPFPGLQDSVLQSVWQTTAAQHADNTIFDFHEQFFSLLSFLQAVYPTRDDLVGQFYSEAWKAVAELQELVKAKSSRSSGRQFLIAAATDINQLLLKLDSLLFADELSVTCAFVCSFPFSQLQCQAFPPVLTFYYFAKILLAGEDIQVTLQRLELNMFLADNDNTAQTHIILPCIRLQGIDYFCLPQRQGLDSLEMFIDHVHLAEALRRQLFYSNYPNLGAIKEIKIVNTVERSLKDHMDHYVKIDVSDALFECIKERSQLYGGTVIDKFCQVITNSFISGSLLSLTAPDGPSLDAFWVTPIRSPSDRHPRLASPFWDAVLPVGTVVRAKYRSLISDDEDNSVEHLAVIISWNLPDGLPGDPASTERVSYNMLCLDGPHPTDTYIPVECARLAEKITAVLGLPKDILINFKDCSILWSFFDSFDGMFFIPQSALQAKYPDDWSRQQAIRCRLGSLRSCT